jgi:hypothetical protein
VHRSPRRRQWVRRAANPRAASVRSRRDAALATGLGAYFLGPAAADLLSDIGVRGVIAIVIIALVGLLYRYVLQRRNPLHP